MADKNMTPSKLSGFVADHFPNKFNNNGFSRMRNLLKEIPPGSETYAELTSLCDALDAERAAQVERVNQFVQAYGRRIDEYWKPRLDESRGTIRASFDSAEDFMKT